MSDVPEKNWESKLEAEEGDEFGAEERIPVSSPSKLIETPKQSPSLLSYKSASQTTPKQSPSTTASIKPYEMTPKLGNRGTILAGGQHVPQHVVTTQEKPSKTFDLSIAPALLPTPKHPSKCPLFCCFYAEFDIKLGPKVCYQSPRNFMEHEIDLPVEQVHQILADTFEKLQKNPSSRSRSTSHDKSDPRSDSTGNDGEGSSDPVGRGNASDTNREVAEDVPDSSSSIFDSCGEYIITGNELTGKIINLSTHHIHVLTRPTIISDERYERNSLLFCVGFVLRRAEDPRPFRPLLSKLALTLRDMEVESQFLSNQSTRPQLQTLLEHILVSLNSSQWECNLLLDPANSLNLKLFHPPKLPAHPVPDYAVPVLLRRDWQVQTVRPND